MINPSFQELSKISSSRYDICVMVMKRARLLIDGAEPLMESAAQKPCTQALDEIMHGKIERIQPDMDEIIDYREKRIFDELEDHEIEA